jgi:hypothetical protein
MTTRVLNFMWLNLDFWPDGSVTLPMPAKYIDNVIKAGKQNEDKDADIVLWVDKKRMTPRQWEFLQTALAEQGGANVHLKDLREIPEYAEADLFNKAETNPHWRDISQSSLIWRQVDVAKILISLQGNYAQTFFADLDHAHVEIGSTDVQGMLKKDGLMVGSYDSRTSSIENQLWGFERHMRWFFEEYFAEALQAADEGKNAYEILRNRIKAMEEEGFLKMEDICLLINNDGTEAYQPGHRWRTGIAPPPDPSVIPGTAPAGDMAALMAQFTSDAGLMCSKKKIADSLAETLKMNKNKKPMV